jgi:hypothetical protein
MIEVNFLKGFTLGFGHSKNRKGKVEEPLLVQKKKK